MAANLGSARVWFISGCSSDVGRELAGLVLRRGGRVILAGPDPSALVDLVASYPTAARALPLDADDDSQVADAVAIAERAFGGIDVLVNIAESSARSVAGTLALTKAVLPGMCARRAGHVVNIGATADGLSEALAVEAAPFGVKIAAVEPSIESVIRFVEAPAPSLILVNGRADIERLRRMLARLPREADDPRGSTATGGDDADLAEPEGLRRAGRAAE
jgi:NAD(P)-dependent dehydrogenase (short-subunit alcohol dehydrogenase family)